MAPMDSAAMCAAAVMIRDGLGGKRRSQGKKVRSQGVGRVEEQDRCLVRRSEDKELRSGQGPRCARGDRASLMCQKSSLEFGSAASEVLQVKAKAGLLAGVIWPLLYPDRAIPGMGDADCGWSRSSVPSASRGPGCN
jgi:hypothetical protein